MMNDFGNKPDDVLVEMTLLGNNKAFEELVKRYERKVLATAYKVTKNRFSAEDASQDAFVSAWTKLNGLKDGTKFGSWVCMIAKNCALNLLRHYRNTASEVCFELLENIDLNENKSEIISFYEQERDESLRNTVEALSEKIRETIKLHYFEEMTVEEIAKKQNTPVGTVKWRLSEGRKKLRKEYGVMENNNNTTFTEKVMYQVEQLKLWNLKNDKTGFEKEYRQVLKNIESLQDGTKKQYMLADVLARGYWWIDAETNEEIFNRIKAAAEKSLNEDVMKFIIFAELEKNKDKKKTEYMENVQVPYLIKTGFKKSLGYLYFWIAYEYCQSGQIEKGIDYFKKVMEVLPKSNGFYAAALGAAHVEERRLREGITPYYLRAVGDVLEYRDSKLYFIEQPGFGCGAPMNSDVLYNCSCCDRIMYDSQLKEGESMTSCSDLAERYIQIDSDGNILPSLNSDIKVSRKSQNVTVQTPCGIYENCICYVSEGEYYGIKGCETYFCKGVGIVKQIVDGNGKREEWQLIKCRINGGDEIIPFATGNRWEYGLVGDSEDKEKDRVESVYEIIYSDSGKAVFSSYAYVSGN